MINYTNRRREALPAHVVKNHQMALKRAMATAKSGGCACKHKKKLKNG